MMHVRRGGWRVALPALLALAGVAAAACGRTPAGPDEDVIRVLAGVVVDSLAADFARQGLEPVLVTDAPEEAPADSPVRPIRLVSFRVEGDTAYVGVVTFREARRGVGASNATAVLERDPERGGWVLVRWIPGATT